MLPTPCYIISDAHLGVASRDREVALAAFLASVVTEARSLVVNGDLFEFWFEWRHVIPRAGFRVLAELARFADHGKPVLWMAGNHDCWGGEVLQRDVGVQYVDGPWSGLVGPWRTRLHHGDGLRAREDRGYRLLKRVVRNRAAMWAFRSLLHPDWASRVALGSSAASRTYAATDKGEGLRHIANAQLAANPELDLVVFGHSHVPTLLRSDAPSGGLYANAGTWLTDSTYLRLDDERIVLRRRTADGDTELAAFARHSRDG